MPNPHRAQLAATQFRQLHVGNAIGKVDVERLIEHDLGMELVLLPLNPKFTERAWLSTCGRRICIDAAYYMSGSPEVCETLMHEVAHAQLHGALLPASPCKSWLDYESFRDRLSPATIEYAEFEAQTFVDHVLVPHRLLNLVVARELASRMRNGVFRSPFLEDFRLMRFRIARRVAQIFGVTLELADRRIRDERVIELHPLSAAAWRTANAARHVVLGSA